MFSTGFQDPLRQELWGEAQNPAFERVVLTLGSQCSETTVLVCLGQAESPRCLLSWPERSWLSLSGVSQFGGKRHGRSSGGVPRTAAVEVKPALCVSPSVPPLLYMQGLRCPIPLNALAVQGSVWKSLLPLLRSCAQSFLPKGFGEFCVMDLSKKMDKNTPPLHTTFKRKCQRKKLNIENP